MIKLAEYRNGQVDEYGNCTLGIGSIVECDCATQYVLENTQFNGPFWRKLRSAPRPAPTDKAWLELG